MISYAPFYKTLQEKGITEYNLIYKQGFSSNILYRMKCGKNISTKTLDELCSVVDCGVPNIHESVKEQG